MREHPPRVGSYPTDQDTCRTRLRAPPADSPSSPQRSQLCMESVFSHTLWCVCGIQLNICTKFGVGGAHRPLR